MKSSLRFFSSSCGSGEGARVSISADQRGEIPLMIGEVCLLRRDLRASIGRNPQSSGRLAKMMRRVGIDSLPREDATRLLGDLQLVCADCPSVPRCEAWMESDRGNDFHSFCPNADIFDKLRSQKPPTHGELIGLIVA
jgi:hypothetical protein